MVNLAHEGHQGLVKTKSLLRENVWFPNIDKLVESKVKSCSACLITTPECKREPLQMSPLPAAPWKELSVDFANLPNQEYLLLITDDYSRYPVVEIVKSTSAATVIPKLDKVFSEFGVPDVVRQRSPIQQQGIRIICRRPWFQASKSNSKMGQSKWRS